MARKLRSSSLEGRSARLKLGVRFKPYTGPTLARGIKLLYRRNQSNGSWVVKASDGHGSYWTKAFAVADDYEDANGESVLTFYEAQDVAKKLARRQGGDVGDNDRPVTLDEALTRYQADLAARSANTYNARMPRPHLAAVMLAKPVQLLTSTELRHWRDGLLAKMKPASVVRCCKSMRAALALAASHDKRIQNSGAWETGLASLPDSGAARNVILDDATVGRFIDSAYARSAELGLLIETLAVTGSRPSQVARLLVEDLHGGAKPRLTMPRSAKGGSRNRAERKHQRVSVPVTPALAAKLKTAAKGRASEAPLLLRADGTAWGRDPAQGYRFDVREIVEDLVRRDDGQGGSADASAFAQSADAVLPRCNRVVVGLGHSA